MTHIDISMAALIAGMITLLSMVLGTQKRIVKLEQQNLGIPKGFDFDDWFCYTAAVSIAPNGDRYLAMVFEADSWFQLRNIDFELRGADARHVTANLLDSMSGRALLSQPCELAHIPRQLERGRIFHPASQLGITFRNDCMEDAFVRVKLEGRKLYKLYDDGLAK